MSETRRKQALYVLLAGAVVFGVYNFSTPRNRYIPGSLAQPDSESASVQEVAPSQPPINIEPLQKADWGRDPFSWSSRQQNRTKQNSSSVLRSEPEPTWSLTAIVFNITRPLAVVNGKTVTIGDTVDRAEVVKIERTKVTLRYNGSNFDIRTRKG